MLEHKSALVTGGAGFIGSAVIRQLVNETDKTVINVDKLTYAGNLQTLAGVTDNPRYRFERVDICDKREVERLLREHRPDAVMHLAAESHVDRSIDGPADFIRTNILGTFTLLEATQAYWQDLEADARAAFRFLHVSTDEVFGSLGESGSFTEQTPYQPNSPYSASKAASDHLVRAWYHTYAFPVLVTNCSNNYGPYQYPEKLIPLMILNAVAGKPLPVYGDGANVRDWIYVEDHASALRLVLAQGRPGETYNIGGRSERTNLDVVRQICQTLDQLRPDAGHAPHMDLVTFVEDRPGHDLRYAIDASKIEGELGWAPTQSFEAGLRRTVEWYLGHRDWCSRVLQGRYQQERLGLKGAPG